MDSEQGITADAKDTTKLHQPDVHQVFDVSEDRDSVNK